MKGSTELEVEIQGRPAPVQVVTDQRDYARWEVQPFAGNPVTTFTMIRFLAWSAMTRQGLYAKPFDVFNDTECLFVGSPDDDDDQDEAEGEQGLDPGRPAATA